MNVEIKRDDEESRSGFDAKTSLAKCHKVEARNIGLGGRADCVHRHRFPKFKDSRSVSQSSAHSAQSPTHVQEQHRESHGMPCPWPCPFPRPCPCPFEQVLNVCQIPTSVGIGSITMLYISEATSWRRGMSCLDSADERSSRSGYHEPRQKGAGQGSGPFPPQKSLDWWSLSLHVAPLPTQARKRCNLR